LLFAAGLKGRDSSAQGNALGRPLRRFATTP
jgi:hypothetical protein